MTRVLSDSELDTFPALEWSGIAASISPELRTALEQVMTSQDGGTLSREQCLLLANAEGDDLLGLLVAADMLRRDLVGNLVTYVVNRNMNFTNGIRGLAPHEFDVCTGMPSANRTMFMSPQACFRRHAWAHRSNP